MLEALGDAMTTRSEVSGVIGVEPPTGAPRETSQPLQSEFVESSRAKAQMNERELAPLRVPGPAAGDLAAQGLVGEPVAAVHEVQAPAGVRAAEPDAALSRAYRTAVARGPAHVGNGSEDPVTAGPTRGMPRGIPLDKQVTGGFGMAEAPTYFALNGLELREMIDALQGHLKKQVSEDLRFGIALTYPRVAVTLTLKVVAYPVDGSFDLVHEKSFEGTSEAEALTMADRQEFEISAEASDTDETPANQIREELGLEIPMKQLSRNSTPKNPMFVDRQTPSF